MSSTPSTGRPSPVGSHVTAGTPGPAPGPAVGPAVGPVAGEWRALSDRFTRIAGPFAGRNDLAVRIAPGLGRGAPACFDPATRVIEIDGNLLEVSPHDAHPRTVRDRQKYPIVCGLLIHESAHARHSWSADGLARTAALEAAILLEESRIEAAQLRRRRRDRRWLRHAARKLIVDDLDDQPTWWAAARAAALVLARTDARVFSPRETAPVRRTLDKVLGRRRVTKLRRVWREAHRLADDDVDGILECGRRWCELTGIDPDAPPPVRIPIPAGGLPRTEANRAAASAIATISGPSWLAGPAGPAGDAGAGTGKSGGQQPPGKPTVQPPAQPPASTIFDTLGTAAPSGGDARWSTRPARDDEKATARKLARVLHTAARRQPVRTRRSSTTPPGAIMMRQAIRGEAQRRAGALPTAEPYRQTRMRKPPEPHLRVGIAIDISASMQQYLQPLASTAWIVAAATAHGGDGNHSATVTFGSHVTAVAHTHPGQRVPPAVPEFELEGSTFGSPLAIDALTEELDLRTPGAARILILATDGELPKKDRRDVEERIADLTRSGCIVVTIAPSNGRPLRGARHMPLSDPDRASITITRAMRAALADWRP